MKISSGKVGDISWLFIKKIKDNIKRAPQQKQVFTKIYNPPTSAHKESIQTLCGVGVFQFFLHERVLQKKSSM